MVHLGGYHVLHIVERISLDECECVGCLSSAKDSSARGTVHSYLSNLPASQPASTPTPDLKIIYLSSPNRQRIYPLDRLGLRSATCGETQSRSLDDAKSWKKSRAPIEDTRVVAKMGPRAPQRCQAGRKRRIRRARSGVCIVIKYRCLLVAQFGLGAAIRICCEDDSN